MNINVQHLKGLLAAIVLFSILGACLFSLIELWTNFEFAYKMKWSFVTIMFTAMVSGLYLENIKPTDNGQTS